MLQQEMIMAIQTDGSALTCITSLRGHSRSAVSLGLITQPTLCECNRSGLVSLKFPFAHSGWHYRCSVTLVTQKWMRVLMGARLLSRNARHRRMITPVNPPRLRLRLIHISPSYQTVYRSFIVWNYSGMGTVYWIGIQIQCSMQTHCFKKTFNLILIKLKKYFRGQLGLQWMSPSKERANVFERSVVANDIFLFTSPVNCTRKANMKRKYMNTDNAQWKEPELTNLISEVGGSTNMQSMQARVLQYKA